VLVKTGVLIGCLVEALTTNQLGGVRSVGLRHRMNVISGHARLCTRARESECRGLVALLLMRLDYELTRFWAWRGALVTEKGLIGLNCGLIMGLWMLFWSLPVNSIFTFLSK
jgi:hypothetical protein